jgi:hypothetical protein
VRVRGLQSSAPWPTGPGWPGDYQLWPSIGGCTDAPGPAPPLAGAALKGNQVLSVLNLSGTRVGNTGAEAVARALRHNTHLKELYLSNTTVDDKGAAALAAALTLNRGLERLHISK